MVTCVPLSSAALHKGLDAELDMSSYVTELHPALSVQKCKSRVMGDPRLGDNAGYAFLFPNFAMNRYGEWFDTNLVLPVSPEKCVIVFDWYHERAADPVVRAQLLAGLQSSMQIQDEDVGISESVQAGLNSRSYDAGRYAPAVEKAELHFHGLLHDVLSRHVANKNRPTKPNW